MRKLRHTLCFRLTDEEMQMYQQLLTHFPLACFQKTLSSRFRALLKSLSNLESYREESSCGILCHTKKEETSRIECTEAKIEF